MSKWLTWAPTKIIRNSTKKEPAKPPKPDFAGFEGTTWGKILLFVGRHPLQRNRNVDARTPKGKSRRVRHLSYRPKWSPARRNRSWALVVLTLCPEGVRLVRYERKFGEIAVTVCSVVEDVPKFIFHALAELDARLHGPAQIKAGDSVFELLLKLADCGLELALEYPPKTLGGYAALKEVAGYETKPERPWWK